MSHSSTKQRIESRQSQRRQAQTRLIIGVVVGALVLTGLLILVSIPRGSADVVVADYSGLSQAIDNSGAIGFAIGEETAPITLVEYSDFSCPHCHDLAGAIERLIQKYGRDGSLRVVFKPVSFVSPPYSFPAAQAAVCAGEQGKFWEMHDQLWSLYESKSSIGYTRPNLVDSAAAIGLDQDQFEACYSSEDTLAEVQGVLDEVEALGIQGTPALYVNGQPIGFLGPEAFYEQMAQVIEAQVGSQDTTP
jgi:protein-disulfide isomerase